jgi:SAM-dependent methyltransferase
MRNSESWVETKFVRTSHGLRGSRDPKELDPTSRCTSDVAAEAYEKVILKHANGALLDLGCGKAPLYGTYKPFVNKVVCVDWLSGLHGSRHLDFVANLNQPLALRDASFDTVLSTSVLEHISDPEILFSEVWRVLRPGGKLLLATPFLYGIHEAPHDYCRYTMYWYREFCQRTGFLLISITPYGGGVDVALHVVGKSLLHTRRSLRQLLVAVTPIVKKLTGSLNQASMPSLPAGYVVVAQRPIGS